MKVNILEAHDRLLSLQKESDSVSQACQHCLKRDPLSLRYQERSSYVYIYAISKTLGMDERIQRFNEDLRNSLVNPSYIRKYKTLEDVETDRLLWQPRLSRPEPAPNSCLFRAKSHSDNIEICWIIPKRELWDTYKKGNVTECEVANWSIDMYVNRKEELGRPYPDDLDDTQAKNILREIILENRSQQCHETMYERAYGIKLNSSEEYQAFSPKEPESQLPLSDGQS